MVTAPRMVGSRIAVRLQRSSEFRRGERDGVLALSHFRRQAVVKSAHRLAQLLKERILGAQLSAVCVESAKLAKEYLAVDPQRLLNTDDLRHRLKLLTEQRLRKHTRQVDRLEGIGERLRKTYTAIEGGVRRLDELQSIVERHQLLSGGRTRGGSCSRE